MPEEFGHINVAMAKEFLKSILNSNEKLINCVVSPLTAPGENYGSIMLTFKLKIRNTTTNQDFQKEVVGKMPPLNKFLQKVYKTDVSFKKEALLYRDVFPILENFYKEKTSKSLEIFPKHLAVRLSLDPKSTTVTNDGLILFENLKLQGFSTHDRMVGFDLNTAKAVLSDLAKFHATPIALKYHQPQLFKETILPVLKYVSAFDNVQEMTQIIDITLNCCSSNDECKRNLDKMKGTLENGLRNINCLPQPREPFATLVHNDLWTNNVMIKNENGDVKCKLIDFQLTYYGSPANDVLFFLSTSLQTFVFKNSFEDLITFYFKELINVLNELEVDTSLFTWSAFIEELKLEAKFKEFFHIIPMLNFINVPPYQVEALESMEEGSLIGEEYVTDEFKGRVIDVTHLFLRNMWI